jgi:phosphatidylserine/phosphatidylglycerophosphate/cardiolipin synthase-like enzyme
LASDVPPELADAIQALASDLPAELVLRVAQLIADGQGAPSWQRAAQVLAALPQPAPRERVRALLTLWNTLVPELSPLGVALALQTAARTADHFRQHQTLELVWTGPDSGAIPMRRTEQALLQLINNAERRLLIVSFAVYKVDSVARSLVEAARRQVDITICLEAPDSGAGKMAHDTVRALGPDVRRHAKLYVWPLERRPLSPAGHHGSLHAKLAVADRRELLISSANLTEFALTLNMELGMLVTGGEWPDRVDRHFAGLIQAGVLAAL